MADTLLHGWEDYARPPHTAAYVAARPLAVAALATMLGRVAWRQPAALALDLNLEDVRAALRRAGSASIGCATAIGPRRATHLGLVPAMPPALVLLCIGSHPAAELKMDELSEIIDTLQATLGPGVEITFWHGGDEVLPPTAVRLWLLRYAKS